VTGPRLDFGPLLERAHREIDDGFLPSCQLAVALDGEVILFETLGEGAPAGNETRYCVFSATKPLVASAVWLLMAEGRLDPAWKVVEVFPEFGANGKDVVTIEQVMLHTSGFPMAPMPALVGDTSAGRVERFAKWRLNWEPGSRFEYHATSAHWVLAELVTRASGVDFRDFIDERITTPLGLPRLLGPTGLAAVDGIAELIGVGEAPAELPFDMGEVTEENLLRFNEPAVRTLGVPGGGAVCTAADMVRFYQALLHNPDGLWDDDILRDATTNVRNTFPDPWVNVPANRTLGLVVCGDDGRGSMRQVPFGKTNSPGAFGHGGAHGQVAWADPATGLSFAYLTNGMDRDPIREARRCIAVGSRAASAALPNSA
jgi:CubicO group peptidase (beta-lactamase class C family)